MKKKEKLLDYRHLMMDDWVLANGKPIQITKLEPKITLEDGSSVLLANLLPLPITKEDLKQVMLHLRNFPGFGMNFRDNAKSAEGPIVDLSCQVNDKAVRYICRPISYYHELQLALKVIGCPLRVNYWWSHSQEKEGESE